MKLFDWQPWWGCDAATDQPTSQSGQATIVGNPLPRCAIRVVKRLGLKTVRNLPIA